MKKYNLKRKGMAAAALTLAFGMLAPSVSFAAGTPVNVLSGTGSQMSSDKEVVYVNNYSAAKRDVNFNDNWKFYLGDASGAEEPAFDDSKWEHVNLPHDYSIEQEYSKEMEAESGYLPGGIGWYRKSFTLGKEAKNKRIRIDFGGVYMDSTVWVNGTQVGSHPYGYTPFSFDITDLVKFDGENVITVKVNHQTPSSRWYSGSGIYRSVDLNIVNPVHVDLYGTKVETPNLETEKDGAVTTNIKTTVANDSDREQNVTLTHTIFKKGGEPSANIGTVTTETKAIAAGETAAIDATVSAQNPELWSTTNPALYTVRTEVKIGEEVVDTYDTEYGFRYFKFDANSGFSLNGTNMKLKGVCMHHDQGALGAEAWERAIERQVEILKEMGCNSIRVTHNPAAEELINICNEKGILVVEEMFDGWQNAKNGNGKDYARFFNQTIDESNQILGKENGMTWAQYDLTATVKRGWNAPSVIMWSLGNEVQEGAGGVLTQAYVDNQKKLIDWTTALDTTRPSTRGDNVLKDPEASQTAFSMMDSMTEADGTVGLNYCNGGKYDSLHDSNPTWKIYGSETASAINSRGVYDRTDGAGTGQKLTSYDNSAVGWGAVASSAWYEVIKRDFVAGEYVWTGFDYIGEPTPWNGTGKGAQGTWPSPKNSYFGIIDTAGFPKDSYYFYQSQWNDEVNTLHILPAWNEDVVKKDGNENVPVVVYTDAKKVELFFTDAETGEKKTLGTKEFTQKQSNTQGYTYQYYEGADKSGTEHQNLYLTWQVPYKAGTISAVAYGQDGQEIPQETLEGRKSVTTTGKKTKLKATVDRDTIAADGADLTYVTVDVTDKDGNIIPNAEDKVTFKVEGEGKLVGVDNGRQDDHTSYQANSRNAFAGKVLAIVQSTKKAGSFTVTASAKGLETSSVTVTTTPVEQDTTVEKAISYYEMSKNYYVKTGNMPQLPSTVKAVYTDGSEKEIPVTWAEITEEQITQSGTFSVAGTTEAGDTLTVIVNMIDRVVSLLNYSTTVPLGTKPTLPESRPAVLQDGEVMNASFPVVWGEPNGSYDAEGIVTVKGTADVLGQNVEVTATIRVENQKITYGESITNAAHLSQDIPDGKQSDTLDAIKDGKKEISDNSAGGPNPTCWSNWATRTEDPTSEITFRYDTQQRVGKVVVYYSMDNGAMSFPPAEKTKLFVSENGNDWEELAVTKPVPVEDFSERVKAYTYQFDPTVATYVKLQVTNATMQEANKNETPCTGITEVEIIEWNGSYTTNSTANLSKLTVNGLELSEEELAAGSFDTEAIVIDTIDYATADNAAVTYVPPYENKAKLIIESEDHTTKNEFVINLNAPSVESEDPTYAGRDYDTKKMKATAGSCQSEEGVEGPAGNVLDGNEGTIWHTSWTPLASPDKFWIKFELGEVTSLDALRYKGRGGASNGRISKYRVEVSKDDQEWTEVSVGNWDNTNDWYIAMFNEPTEAKYVRLTGVETYGEGSQQNKFASAAEIRLRKADSKTNISDATVSLVNEKKLVSVVDKDHPVTLSKEDIEVTLGDKVLRYGIDYKLTYSNNEAPGTATAIVTGIGQYGYTGSQEVSFTIELKKPEMNNISIKSFPTKTTYKEGETLDPTGLVLTTSYDNGTTAEVVYSEETAKDFTFDPDTKTALTKENTKVTVTYGDFETEFAITVTEAEKPDPENPDPENPDPENPDPENPDPEKPDPEKPDSGNQGSGNQGSGKPDGNGGSTGNTDNTNNSNNAVQTGDAASVGIWVVALAAAGIVGAIMIGKKRKDVK